MDSIVLTPAQDQIARDKHKFRVVCAGRRFGKSLLSVVEMVGNACRKSDRKVCYIAPTHQMCRDIAWDTLKKYFGPNAQELNESRLEAKFKALDGGISTIFFRGWEAVETLRGQGFDFIVIDEIASMRKFEEGWETVVRPTLLDRSGEALFISTPKGFNHFYYLFNREQVDKDYKSFHFTSYDNPGLPKEELDKERAAKPEDYFAQEYLADFRKTHGLVYKEFDRKLHLYDQMDDRMCTRLVGVDFGYRHPTAIPLVLEDSQGNFWVEDEWCKPEQMNAQIVTAVKNFRPAYVYPDPEAPEKIEELKNSGLCVLEVNKGKDSIINGINQIRELLKTGQLKINKRCLNLIAEFESYHYPDGPDKEVPEKENNDMLDALRYIVISRTRALPIKVITHRTFNDLYGGI